MAGLAAIGALLSTNQAQHHHRHQAGSCQPSHPRADTQVRIVSGMVRLLAARALLAHADHRSVRSTVGGCAELPV